MEIPQDIINSAIEIDHFFKKQGIKPWALCNIRSRFDDDIRRCLTCGAPDPDEKYKCDECKENELYD